MICILMLATHNDNEGESIFDGKWNIIVTQDTPLSIGIRMYQPFNKRFIELELRTKLTTLTSVAKILRAISSRFPLLQISGMVTINEDTQYIEIDEICIPVNIFIKMFKDRKIDNLKIKQI